MNTFLKNLGLIIVLLGVVCLVIDHYIPSNALLVTALVLEVSGILLHILLGRTLE